MKRCQEINLKICDICTALGEIFENKTIIFCMQRNRFYNGIVSEIKLLAHVGNFVYRLLHYNNSILGREISQMKSGLGLY